MKTNTFVLMLLVASLVLGEKQACHDIPAMQDFDFSLFHGEWYTLMANMVPRSNKCMQQIFQETNQNSSIIFKLTHRRGNQTFAITYDGPIWTTDSPGKLEFTIRDEFPEANLPYWVLDTDYHNYAVTYICWQRNPSSVDYITVLGRNTSLSAESRIAVNTVLESINLVPDQLVEVSHTNCLPRAATFS